VAEPGDLPLDEYDSTMRLVRLVATRLKQATHADGLNIGINVGRPAGAGIADHMHVHVVPRWIGDSNFMPVIADTRVMPEYLSESFDRLRASFADLEGEHPVD
jgi:ATP adenylyltransferase